MKRDNAVRRLTVAAMLLTPTIAWAQLPPDDTRASPSVAPGAELEFGLLPLEHYRSLIIRDSYEAEFRRLVTAEKLAEAEAVGEKMLTIDRDVLRDDPTRLMESLELVARLLAQRQDFGRALTLEEEKHRLLAERPETSPQELLEHLQIVETVRSMAQWTTEQRLVFGQVNSLFEQAVTIGIEGDWQRADAKFEEAIVQLHMLVGTEHLLEVPLQFVFGNALATTDHIPLALNRLQTAESICARVFGDDSKLLREIRIELANVLRRATEQHLNAAKFDLASATAERHLQVQQKVHAADSDSVIDAQALIKHVTTVAALDPEQRAHWAQSVRDESQPLSLWREGKADEAERAAGAMLETCVDLLGNDSRQSLMARRTVAQIQSVQGHYGSALANYQGILEQRISSYGATHGETSLAANDIVRTLESIANALVGDIDSVSIHSAELLLQSLFRETDWRRIGAERSIARIAHHGKLTPAERLSLVDVQRSEQTASKLSWTAPFSLLSPDHNWGFVES